VLAPYFPATFEARPVGRPNAGEPADGDLERADAPVGEEVGASTWGLRGYGRFLQCTR